MPRVGALVIALSALMALTGCASSGKKFDTTHVNDIETDKTTRAQVDAWFGPPASQTSANTPQGAVLRYTYTYAYSSWGGAKTTSKSLVVDFNAQNVVVDHAYVEQ